MTPVSWAQTAISDLASIYEYIEKDSPSYAITVADRLTDRTKQLAEFPSSGQMVPEYHREDVREVIVYNDRLTHSVAWRQHSLHCGYSRRSQSPAIPA